MIREHRRSRAVVRVGLIRVLALVTTTFVVAPLLFVAMPASAFEMPDTAELEAEDLVHMRSPLDWIVYAATEDEADERETAVGRLHERLERIPLRPVAIGETPRLPSDPEPGLGVVVKLAF